MNDSDHTIETRDHFGHWEIDTVVGRRKGKEEVLLTLVERKTRHIIIRRIDSKVTPLLWQELKALKGNMALFLAAFLAV